MSKPVVLRRAAQAELAEAYSHYESERLGLGQEFLEAVTDRLARVSASPESSPLVYRDVQEALLKRFPFAIYFREEDHQIVVFSVFHCSRDPARWQKRVD